jgi:hypothetical protein
MRSLASVDSGSAGEDMPFVLKLTQSMPFPGRLSQAAGADVVVEDRQDAAHEPRRCPMPPTWANSEDAHAMSLRDQVVLLQEDIRRRAGEEERLLRVNSQLKERVEEGQFRCICDRL